MMLHCSIHVPYFGEELYIRKVPLYEHVYDLRSASAAIYYLVFKAVIAALNELLFTNPY
jgi:hypothetical protein